MSKVALYIWRALTGLALEINHGTPCHAVTLDGVSQQFLMAMEAMPRQNGFMTIYKSM
jgi:hypothetical protein